MALKQGRKKHDSSKKAKGASGNNAPPLLSSDDPSFDSDDGATAPNASYTPDPDMDPDDPKLTTPLTRYNAMLAVLRNTLYMYVTFGSRRPTTADGHGLLTDVCFVDTEVSTSEARKNTLWMIFTLSSWINWIDISA